MSLSRNSLILPALLGFLPVLAQPANDDCAGAVALCDQQGMAGDNTAATDPGPCGTSATVWYTFTTNSAGGTAEVSITGIVCPSVLGMDNELGAVVLSGDGSCSPASFLQASLCAGDSVDFGFTTFSLAPATTYWIVVGGLMNDGAILPAECAFNITVGGPGVQVVDVDFDAGPDVTIPAGASTQLNAAGGVGHQWSPTSGLSGNLVPDPVAQPTETTVYSVTATVDGCVFTDALTVEVIRLIAPPNTITPNGDGINDTWEIPGIQDYPQADVRIYDRWGQRVFQSIGYREPFDGRSLPTATYYWHIDLNQLTGKADPYTGFITIVR
ncbi:MAG TPA: gliding motility-associated C-terminal domain-containing protein [Flavobacteriales bacterium]